MAKSKNRNVFKSMHTKCKNCSITFTRKYKSKIYCNECLKTPSKRKNINNNNYSDVKCSKKNISNECFSDDETSYYDYSDSEISELEFTPPCTKNMLNVKKNETSNIEPHSSNLNKKSSIDFNSVYMELDDLNAVYDLNEDCSSNVTNINDEELKDKFVKNYDKTKEVLFFDRNQKLFIKIYNNLTVLYGKDTTPLIKIYGNKIKLFDENNDFLIETENDNIFVKTRKISFIKCSITKEININAGKIFL